MSIKVSQITSLTIVYSTVCAGADQRKHQSSASLAFVWGIHRWPVNSLHKGPVTRKMFPFDDIIMQNYIYRMKWLTKNTFDIGCKQPRQVFLLTNQVMPAWLLWLSIFIKMSSGLMFIFHHISWMRHVYRRQKYSPQNADFHTNLMSEYKVWAHLQNRLYWYECLVFNDGTSSWGPSYSSLPWWHHQMETFYTLLALCVGNPWVNNGFPS